MFSQIETPLMYNKVLIVGDVHGFFKDFNNIINKYNPDLVVQVGDLGYFPKFLSSNLNNLTKEYPIVFCDGNHEDHESLQNLEDGIITSNLTYMHRGKILNINGYNFMFMGGAASIDKNQRIPMVDWFPQEELSLKDVMTLNENSKVDCMISHTAPIEFHLNLEFDFKDGSRNILSELLKLYKPKEWYFGHFHMNVSGVYVHDDGSITNWRCLDKVYPNCYFEDARSEVLLDFTKI